MKLDLNEKEINYIRGNLIIETACLRQIKARDSNNVVNINTLSKEEKDRLVFLESFLKKVQEGLKHE